MDGEVAIRVFPLQQLDGRDIICKDPIKPCQALIENQEMSSLFQQLTDLHHDVSARSGLRSIEDRIVRDPDTRAPLWESYIPFVGPSYERDGLFLVGTAQSLAKLSRPGRTSDWHMATGLPGRPLHRLYRVGRQTVDRPLIESEVTFESIAIQPYMDGIFAGIAGAALAAFGWGTHDTLVSATRRIAVTNFFKQSLQTQEGTDLNPLSSALPKDLGEEYLRWTLREYLLEEIDILQPRVVIAFNRQIADEIRKAWHEVVPLVVEGC